MKHELPFFGCWNTGENQIVDGQDVGYGPDWQHEQIMAGRSIVPTFELFTDNLPQNLRHSRFAYFEPLWLLARRFKFPLHFIGRNFTDMFRLLEPWASMTTGHPFIQYEDGTIKRQFASPWSKNAGQWYSLGRRLGEHLRSNFAADYPDCPDVILFDNNESGIAPLEYALRDIACPSYVKQAEGQHAHREMWDRYRLRRASLMEGIQDACPEWADVIRIFSYGEFGQAFQIVDNNPGLYHYPWSDLGKLEFSGYDGVTANIGYLHSWSSHAPNIVRSPQVEACNARYALQQYRRAVNPVFGLETHFWNGKGVDVDVWRGVVRCVMWIMRSKSNRLFLGSTQTRADTYERDMRPLVESVEEVRRNPVLRGFWEHGVLLQNRWQRDFSVDPAVNQYDKATGYGHPYQFSPPAEEYDAAKRWYLQHVPFNKRLVVWNTLPGGQDGRMVDRWQLDRERKAGIDVFAVCLQYGSEFLIYAHAPGGEVRGVEIVVCPSGAEPLFTVRVDVPVGGAFWCLSDIPSVGGFVGGLDAVVV